MFRSFIAMSAAVMIAPLWAAPAAQVTKVARDPNEKICEVVTPVGSRLATKKVCATRAEWEDKRRQDREATEKAQTQLCVVNPVTGKC